MNVCKVGIEFWLFFEARRRGTVMHDDAQVSPSQVDRQNCFSNLFYSFSAWSPDSWGQNSILRFFSPSRNQYYISLNITYPNLRHSIHWLIGIIRIKMTTTWRHTPLSHAPISIVPWKPPFFQHVCWWNHTKSIKIINYSS